MKDSVQKFDEEALRKKIREELERQHQENQRKLEQPPEIKVHSEEKESHVLEVLLEEQVEEEVFSQYPEFIKCANHLNEVRWFTPTELEEDYEYYPVEETRTAKLKKKFFKKRDVTPISPEILEMLETYRKDLEIDAQKRIAAYHEKVKLSQKNIEKNQMSEIEQRLYEEELDLFYGAKQGYKKYKNHTGDTKWMTKTEFEQQDEFIDVVLTKKQIIIRRTSRAVIGLLVIAIIVYLGSLVSGGAKPAYLLVEMEEVESHLYIDQNPAFGFKPNELYRVNPGKREIMVVRPGYITSPQNQLITFIQNDTVKLSLQFTPEPMQESGIVQIKSNIEDASVIVDGQFRGVLGNNPFYILPAGDHTISLELAGYTVSPRQKLITLISGDSLNISFRLIPSKVRKKSTDITSVGMIEVTSNIKDADIYLDGQNTGYKTDYILQKISVGQHIVRVEKDGYKVYPEEKTAKLTKNTKSSRVHFNLSSITQPVVIQTIPQKGEIFIDGKSMASGIFRGSMQPGIYEVSFGQLPGFKAPAVQNIEIQENIDNNFYFSYISEFKIEFQPGQKGDPDYESGIASGHILEGIRFKASNQTGPEIANDNSLNQDVWQISYAFQYRNPPGMDAVAFRFKLPESAEVNKKIYLKLWIYKTKNNYPLTLKGKSAYRIIINNSIYKSTILPENSIIDISESRYVQFEISEYLRSTYNTIIISASPEASAAVALWKVVIE